jgi:uncharacterized protein (DUF3084 family)
MAITDAERHRLHTKLDEVLGEEDAAVLISHLPPSGWSDVVRTRDLDQFEARVIGHVDQVEARLGGRIDRLDGRIDQLGGRLDQLDGRIDQLDGRIDQLDGRIDRLEERMDHRFALVDERFNTMEARVDATIERALRQQTHRFLGGVAALVATVATVQGVVLNLVG